MSEGRAGGLLLCPMAFRVLQDPILPPVLFNIYWVKSSGDLGWAVINMQMTFSSSSHFQLIPGRVQKPQTVAANLIP